MAVSPRKNVQLLNRTGTTADSTTSGVITSSICGIKFLVLIILCLQNSLFTVLRRYSQGILKESYSKHEVLLVGEIIKMLFSSYMICQQLEHKSESLSRIIYLTRRSSKMFMLAFLYGSMNILSYIALQYISASTFVIIAQCKILTTASFSAIMLRRSYSSTKWRALISLMLGVLLFSAPVLEGNNNNDTLSELQTTETFYQLLGTAAVLTEVTLSGFASIYFEKVIKVDPEKLSIWERNYQLALWSCPIYLGFMLWNGGDESGFAGGWSTTAFLLSMLGAAGGLLVALSIKYGDSILKTLAVTGSIILSSLLDHYLLGGPLTPIMMIAGTQVIIAICNYTFDMTPPSSSTTSNAVLVEQQSTTTTPNTPPPGVASSEMIRLNSFSKTSTSANTSNGGMIVANKV